MYRTLQCYNCKFLEECDKFYDEETGEFDYPKQEMAHSFGFKNKLVPKKGGVWDIM